MSALFEPLGEFASRLDFAALLGDGERLLKVRTALPALALLPEHVVLRESVSQPFELVLDCVSTSAQFELKQVLGEQMTVSLKHADGSYVPWHGYVTQAAQLGSDGGLARYRLTMGPWLAWLGLRRDSFVFQDKTALEIVEAVFADYPAAQWRLEVSDDTLSTLRKRSLCTQYRETDLAFVSRLLAQEGLHFWFEHLGDDDGAQADTQNLARHVMVIADAQVQRTNLGPIRFAAQHPTAFMPGLEDPVTSFMAQRRLTTNAVAVGSWDHAKLAGTSASAQTLLNLGDVPTLERYDGAGAYRYQDADGAGRAAALALAAQELRAKRFEGIGAARILRAGARFSLIDHASYGANTTAFDYAGALLASHDRADNAFTVLAVEHEASNNLGSEAARLLGRGTIESGTYKNRFECVLAAVPVVPPHSAAPTAPAALSARVVGIEDTTVHSERGHRVKVQMHFQRGESPNAGNGPTGFGTDELGNAPGDERSGTWVRVGGPAAGANWGALYTPRIGSEVTVQFIEGDIDRPIIVGGLYGGADAMPFSAGVDSGVNHPGVIAGLHSQRLDGDGFNQFALDDAPGQLRTRLHASHADAELGLGHLIQHSADGAQRGAWRGSGFEAGTAGWSSVRAGAGLLVSTSARAGTYGSAQATQMDTSEGVAQLNTARDLGQRLGQAASAVNAQGLATHDDGQALAKFVKAIDPTQDGKHPDSVNGQPAKQPADDGRSAGDQAVHAYAQPVMLFDTPSATLAASSASMATFAGQAISIVAQGDLQQTAAHTMTQASGTTTSVYAHQGGILAMAANGPVSLRAHTDALSILADQSVTITSVNDEIRIGANQQIQLVAGQSAITLKGGDIDFTTPGAFMVHGATHAFEAGANGTAALPRLPLGLAQIAPDQVVIEHEYHDEENLVGAPYRAILSDGTERTGTLDGAGQAILSNVPGGTDVSIVFGPMPGAYEPKDQRPMPDHKPTPGQSDMDALVDKYSGGQA
jgi:type VI secretion system secreted protein VgrG